MPYQKENARVFIDEIWKYVILPDVKQTTGSWVNSLKHPEKCCVGARIAKAYNLETPRGKRGHYYYRRGWDKTMRELGLSKRALNFLLYVCGSTQEPFYGGDWPNPPEYVFAKLGDVEWVPSSKWLRERKVENWYLDEYAKRHIYGLLCAPRTRVAYSEIARYRPKHA